MNILQTFRDQRLQPRSIYSPKRSIPIDKEKLFIIKPNISNICLQIQLCRRHQENIRKMDSVVTDRARAHFYPLMRKMWHWGNSWVARLQTNPGRILDTLQEARVKSLLLQYFQVVNLLNTCWMTSPEEKRNTISMCGSVASLAPTLSPVFISFTLFRI